MRQQPYFTCPEEHYFYGSSRLLNLQYPSFKLEFINGNIKY